MSKLEQLRTWGSFAAEVVRKEPLLAPKIISKAINAWAVARLAPKKTMLSGLWQQPFDAAPDYVAYWGDGQLNQTLRLINWQGRGRELVEDKLISAERYAEHGIATVPILGVAGRDEELHPHGGRFTVLRTEADVLALLRSAPSDLIVKPAGGSRGGEVRSLSRAGNRWLLADTLLQGEELAALLVEPRRPEGFLVQPRMRSHPELYPVGGSFGLCSARINTALLDSGAVVLFQFFKLMGGPGVIDNFGGGKSGNLLAAIDRPSGQIVNAYGRSPGDRFLLSKVARHPMTGAPLPGFHIPQWDEAVDLAIRAAEVCPETPLVGADVAITEAGPMMVEINAAWDADYAELTEGCGLRVLLRRIWPELRLDPEVKTIARKRLML